MVRVAHIMAAVVVCAVSGLMAQGGYAPLGLRDRQAFVRLANAVKAAAAEKNYAGVMRFAPGILQKYESVLLDPKCKGLRALYEEVEALMGGIAKAEAASSTDITELFAFRERFPGLYTEDIEALISSHKAKMRVGIKRKPSIEKIEAFYAVYPEPDRVVDSIHQRLLYKEFTKEPDVMGAMRYLASFPDGRYAKEMRTFVDVQQEQQKIAQMRQLQAGQQGRARRGGEDDDEY